jgi:NAD(P)-dependent dehydrogenase (short-subunit alcohol dehydrogenase family)
MSTHKALAIVAGAGPGLYIYIDDAQLLPTDETKFSYALIGTGSAIARAFAAKGFRVALLARTAANLTELEQSIKSSGGEAASFPTDLTQPSSVHETFKSIRSKFPNTKDTPWKVAVFNMNNKWVVKPFLQMDESEYIGNVNSMAGAAFSFSQEVVREMDTGGHGGTLIFTGATAAMRGSAKFAAIASPSFAVRALRLVYVNRLF